MTLSPIVNLARGAAVLAIALSSAAPSLAQSPAATLHLAQATSPPNNSVPGATNDTSKPGPAPTLSEKLDATNGVITPPANVDPEMTQKPPRTGSTMPVIPPSAVTPEAPKGESK